MATIDPLQAYTIADMARAMPGPDGKPLPIYDALRRKSTLLADAIWQQASHPEYHRMQISDIAIRASKVALNEGVAGTKKTFRQVDAYMGRYEDNSQVDTRAKEIYPDILAYRNKMDTLKAKDIAFQFDEAILSETLGADGKGFVGLQGYLNKLNSTDATKLVYGAAGGSAWTSIYFVSWGEDTVFLTHPKGSKTFGVTTEDKGEVRVLDANGNPYYAYETWLTMRGGLAVQNMKSIARIANIASGTDGVFGSANIMKLVNRIMPQMHTSGKVYAYMSPLMWSHFQDWVQDKANINYKVDDFGQTFQEFAGITWRVSDNIGNNEAAIA
jgi:hypothetical protein